MPATALTTFKKERNIHRGGCFQKYLTKVYVPEEKMCKWWSVGDLSKWLMETAPENLERVASNRWFSNSFKCNFPLKSIWIFFGGVSCSKCLCRVSHWHQEAKFCGISQGVNVIHFECCSMSVNISLYRPVGQKHGKLNITIVFYDAFLQ